MNNIASLKFFSGEIVLLIGAFVVLFSDFFFKNKKYIGFLALGFICLSALAYQHPEKPLDLFFGFFRLDSITDFFRTLSTFSAGFCILLSIHYEPLRKNYLGEYYSLLLFTTFGLILMSASRNLLMIYLSIEFVSTISYMLTGFLKDDTKSKEASLKYLLFGSACSGMMLYGMSLLYGLTGSLDLSEIAAAVDLRGWSTLFFTAMLLIFTGIGFKISMAPFHMWAPDVYEGAPTPFTAFISAGPKAIGFAVFLRVLTEGFGPLSGYWVHVLIVLSIMTMTAGNVIAVSQNNIKRLLAYSSVAQGGYLLMGLAVYSETGEQALLYYLAVYMVANLGAFATILAASEKLKTYEMGAYAGLSRRAPFLSASLAIFLLSLAGIPPLAGFVGKFLLFQGALERGYITLVIAALVNSIIGGFYYLRVVRAMYLLPSRVTTPLPVPFTLKLAIGAALAATLLIGILPGPVIDIVRKTLLAG